jgi:hypothetical protein
MKLTPAASYFPMQLVAQASSLRFHRPEACATGITGPAGLNFRVWEGSGGPLRPWRLGEKQKTFLAETQSSQSFFIFSLRPLRLCEKLSFYSVRLGEKL